MIAPADGPSAGCGTTLPADGRPSGWWAWRQRRISSSRPLMTSAGSAVEAERRAEDEVGGGALGDRHLEPAVAVAEVELRGLEARLGPVGEQHVGRLEDRGDVVLVGAGVRPDRAADRARDRQPELEAGEAGLLGLGRRPGHRHAGLGGVAVAVDLRALGPVLDDEAADPGVGDDDVAPPPEERVRQLAAPGEADERPQLVDVVDGREEVGRAADAHRREPGERLVADRLDADPPLDRRPDRDRVEARSPWPPSSRPPRARVARSRRHRGTAGARRRPARARRPPRRRRAGRRRRAASAIAARAASSASRSAASTRTSASKASSGTSRAAPASARTLRVRRLVAGRVRVRDDDRRDAEGRHLGQRRRAGPPDDEVRGDERRQHLVAQERVRPVAGPQVGGQPLSARRARPRSRRRRSRGGCGRARRAAAAPR